jgi:transcriptional regulator with XRE-family HTH domain
VIFSTRKKKTPRTLLVGVNDDGPRTSKTKHLAAKLLTLRQRLGLSQPQIARRLGIQEYTNISKYERNINEPPLAVLLAYAKLINVSVEVLIDDERELQF